MPGIRARVDKRVVRMLEVADLILDVDETNQQI
jgi:hypothetical protein